MITFCNNVSHWLNFPGDLFAESIKGQTQNASPSVASRNCSHHHRPSLSSSTFQILVLNSQPLPKFPVDMSCCGGSSGGVSKKIFRLFVTPALAFIFYANISHHTSSSRFVSIFAFQNQTRKFCVNLVFMSS